MGDRGAAPNFVYIKYVRPVLPLLWVPKQGQLSWGGCPEREAHKPGSEGGFQLGQALTQRKCGQSLQEGRGR